MFSAITKDTYLRTLGTRSGNTNKRSVSGVKGTKRLMREIKALELETVPMVGIFAMPYKDCIKKWRILLTGPKDSIYEGLYLRVEMILTDDYPRDPPASITVVGDKVPHPYIFGNSICLQNFQKNKDQSKGWNSLYTLESIFQQLHGFLWEGHFAFKDHKKNKKLIKQLIKKNEVFKYGDEKNHWPKSSKEEEFDPDEFLTHKNELEVYKDNLRCFHTKEGVKERALGYGVKVTRIARTGEVKHANSIESLISLRAFVKYGIRRSAFGETFGYWVPVYFGENTKDRTLHLAKRALSFIMTNNTQRFEPIMAPKVLLKTLFSSILKLVNSKEKPTITQIRQIVHYHSLILLFAKEYPEITDYMDEMVGKFLEKEENRVKSQTSSLGLILVCCLLSDKHKFEDLLAPYFGEQLDRQVFWILTKIPELEDETNTISIDKNRVEVTFASQILGYRLTMFFNDYNRIIKSQYKDTDVLLNFLGKNYCKLPNAVENQILDSFKDVIENVKNYGDYFKKIGLPEKSQDELIGMLKKAVKNSKEKRYHGEVDDVIGLPEEKEQIQQYLAKTKNILDHCQDGKLPQLEEDQWRGLCFERWEWMRNYYNADYERNTGPREIAREYEKRDTTAFIYQSDGPEIYSSEFKSRMDLRKTPSQYYEGVQDYEEGFTWKELYCKLDLEEFVATLNHHQDFKSLYRRLDAVAPIITNLTLYITSSSSLKSGYYYLCSVLSFLKKLRVLTIQNKGLEGSIPYKAAVNLKKGFSKLNKDDESKLVKLRVKNCNFLNQNNTSEAMLEIFTNIPKLVSLDLDTTNLLLLKQAKFANMVIVNHPNIRELRVVRAANTDQVAKSIADGLMRAKKLEYLQYNHNSSPNGITNLLYNLAFSPKLTILDFSQNQLSDRPTFVENLTKLISISPCIEYLNLNNLQVLTHFTRDMYKAIGENLTLNYLDLGANASCPDSILKDLAHSVAINASKKGDLQNLFLDSTLSYRQLKEFVNHLWTSPYFEETWYGDSYRAEKMGGDSRKKKYVCNLQTLEISNSGIYCPHFKYENYINEIEKSLPDWLKLFTICGKLEYLGMRNSSLTNYHLASLRALYEKGFYHVSDNLEKEPQCTLKKWNLSNNSIDKESSKHLAEVLKKLDSLEILQLKKCSLGVAGAINLNPVIAENKSYKILDLAANKIEVDGARKIAKALKTNTSLQFLDLGFNKIRDEGLRVIGESLAENTHSGIKCLGIRGNLLTDAAFETLITNLSKNESAKLNSLLFRGNEQTDFYLKKHIETAKKYNQNLFVDIFNKAFYLKEDILKRSIWVELGRASLHSIVNFFRQKEVGVVVNARVRGGKKYETISSRKNFALVEFAHPLSVDKALILVSKRKNNLNGRSFQIYRAGSSTFYYNKNCKSSKFMKSFKF